MPAFGWRSLRWPTAAILVLLLFVVYDRWREGATFYVPGRGRFYRFPCSSYRYIPPIEAEVIQAFGIIDGAALAARANDRDTVVALVDAVFDRLLPAARCGNPFRHRVAEAEMSFRRGRQPAISERELSEAANDVLAAAGAPTWARTSVAQMHLLRESLRPELPRFIGTVASEYRLSDRLSPVEAAFVSMELANGVLDDPTFRDGPDAWVRQVRALQANPSPSEPRLVVRVGVPLRVDIERDVNEKDSATSRSGHQFLDRLGFPR